MACGVSDSVFDLDEEPRLDEFLSWDLPGYRPEGKRIQLAACDRKKKIRPTHDQQN